MYSTLRTLPSEFLRVSWLYNQNREMNVCVMIANILFHDNYACIRYNIFNSLSAKFWLFIVYLSGRKYFKLKIRLLVNISTFFVMITMAILRCTSLNLKFWRSCVSIKFRCFNVFSYIFCGLNFIFVIHVVEWQLNQRNVHFKIVSNWTNFFSHAQLRTREHNFASKLNANLNVK